MIKNSKKAYYLADHDKVHISLSNNLITLGDIDGIITDYVFSDELKEKYPDTKFIEVEIGK